MEMMVVIVHYILQKKDTLNGIYSISQVGLMLPKETLEYGIILIVQLQLIYLLLTMYGRQVLILE